VKRIRITLVLVVALMLLAVISVSAAPPSFETGTFELNYMPFVPSPCPNFDLTEHEVGTYRYIYYYDKQGNLLNIRAHYQGIDEWYNPAHPDVVLSGPFNGTILFDANWNVLSFTGLGTGIRVPGYGTVLQVAGRQIPGGKWVGKNSTVDPKDLEQICSMLGD
jgi:hypothetical protein